jgi:hypothetical protein
VKAEKTTHEEPQHPPLAEQLRKKRKKNGKKDKRKKRKKNQTTPIA